MSVHPYQTKISATSELDYLREHFGRLKNAVKEMDAAITEDNAGKFIDHFGALQLQERSLIFACNSMMQRLGFTEQD